MKFQSFIKYFDWLESQATAQNDMREQARAEDQAAKGVIDASSDDANTFMKVSRKVFSGKQWLTIEDWLECTVPLCALEVKHEGRIERSEDNVVQTVFASSRLGGDFLSNGWSQVSWKMFTVLAIINGVNNFFFYPTGMFRIHSISGINRRFIIR